MNHIDNEATARVLKARSALILARRFYGVLVSNVEPVLSRSVETMATNGKQHFFNPDFIGTLAQAELEAVQAHETEHDARHHGTRRGARDPKQWNIACDYAINPDLMAEGFKLPSWVLFDERFRGMSAEDIYRTRELDEQKDKPAPQPQPGPQEKGEDESEDQQEPEAQDGQEQGEEADDEEGDQDGPGGPQDGEDEADGAEGQDGTEASQEAPDGPGDGPGQGEGPAEGPSEGQGEGEGPGEGEAAGEGEGSPRGSSGDPGRCGEVLDAAEDAGEIAEQDHRWERITRQAVSMARSVGQLPGHISRDIERANQPEQDWREVLRAWFDQGALQSESWNRPNRRLVGSGLYLPGKRRDGINRVAFLIDTSGSMDDIALALVRNEAQAALDDGVIDEVVCVYGDTRVTKVDEYRTSDEIEFDPRGGGGTRLRPLFEHVETLDDVSLIVCFTDMENYDWGPEPSCPVLFAATGYPETVRAHLAKTPWNAPGIDVGAH